MASFGENLQKLIEKQSLSISRLAKAIDLSPKTVQEWVGKNGRMPRDPNHLKKLAKEFNCTVHYLLYGEEDPRGIIGQILEKTEIHTGLYEITIKNVHTKKGGDFEK